MTWQAAIGWGEVARGWVEIGGVGLGLIGWVRWTDLKPGAVVRVDLARSTAPTKKII